MPTLSLEVTVDAGEKITLRVPLSDELWHAIELMAKRRTEAGNPTTFEDVAREALGIGLSMTRGVG